MLSRARVALLVLLLAVATIGPAAGQVVAPASAVDQHPQVNDATAQQEQPGETTFRVQLRPNGNARWTVLMNFSLATEAREDAFEAFAAQFEASNDLRTLTAVRQASQQVSSETGRQMSITNVEQTSRTRNETGQLVLRFTWTNFSRQSNQSLHVDDVFNATSGTWFSELSPSQSLVIVPPQGYSLVDAAPPGYGVSNGSLQWDGRRTFEPGAISVTYEREPVSEPAGFPLLVVALVVAGMGVVVTVAYLFSNRDLTLPPVVAGSTTEDEDETTASVDGGTGAETPSSPASPAETTADDDSPDDDIDEELLSDEERIERLLESNGGRMKQANIVKETGWSNAKVSQLLSAMDDAERIDKLRIGRENLISFPDEDITDTNGDDS